MKHKIQILSSVAAVATLLFSSCGDGGSSSETPDGPGETPSAGTSVAGYSLDVCVVSGEKLGSMGAPHVIKHEGTEVRFCCDACVPEFNKDPDKYIAMIKAGKAGSMDHSGHNK